MTCSLYSQGSWLRAMPRPTLANIATKPANALPAGCKLTRANLTWGPLLPEDPIGAVGAGTGITPPHLLATSPLCPSLIQYLRLEEFLASEISHILAVFCCKQKFISCSWGFHKERGIKWLSPPEPLGNYAYFLWEGVQYPRAPLDVPFTPSIWVAWHWNLRVSQERTKGERRGRFLNGESENTRNS